MEEQLLLTEEKAYKALLPTPEETTLGLEQGHSVALSEG